MTSEDALFARLAEIADEERQQGAVDPSFERRAAGTLSDEELEQLREWSLESEATRFAFAASEPVDEATQQQVIAQLLDKSIPAGSTSNIEEQAEPTAAARPSKATSHRRPWQRAVVWSAPILAAAALVLVWFGAPSTTPLPRYQVSVLQAGNQPARLPEPLPNTGRLIVTLGTGEAFSLALRPATKVPGRVEMAAYRLRDGVATRWPIETKVAPTGAFLVAGPADELLAVEPGDWTLVFVFGHPGQLPKSAAEVAAAVAAPAKHNEQKWQLATQSVTIRPAPANTP